MRARATVPLQLYALAVAIALQVFLTGTASAATVGSRFDPDDVASLGALNLSSGVITFNTTDLTVTGFPNGVSRTTQSGLSVAVYCFDSVSLTGSVTVNITGSRPIAILSKTDITLARPLSVNGAAAAGNTGGVAVASGAAGGNANVQGGGTGYGGMRNSDGGAGAGYGNTGGQGASGNTNGRLAYGTADLYDLLGGSGGGGGGAASNSAGGGAGGGAIELSANGAIVIQAGGAITANGGDGGTAVRYGGGGGSGGAILLNAVTVQNGGLLQARGGNGGPATQAGREGGGGGAGGRVAIYANELTIGTVSVAGGAGGAAATSGGAGGNGTTHAAYFDPPPSVTGITRLDATPTNDLSVRFRVTFSEAVQNVVAGDFQLATTGSLTGASVTGVSGSGATRDVTVATGSGDGTLRLDLVDFDTVLDAAGFPLGGSGQRNGDYSAGETYSVDKSAPTIAIGAPTPALTRTGSVTYSVTYAGADSVSLAAANVTLVKSGSANGTVAVSGTGNTTRTVTISNISGNGTLAVSIAANTAGDAAGNSVPGIDGDPCTVDNAPPTLAVGAPSATVTRGGPVSFTVTYEGADSVSLAAANVSLVKGGTANASSVTVSGTGTATRTVTLSGISGNGTLGIAIAAGTAADEAGNTAPASGNSATFQVDNTAPTVTIGAPSPAATRNGPVTFTVTYGGADAVTLTGADVSLVAGGGATGTVSVGGTGNTTRTITIDNISGNGTLGVSIAPGTAADAAGNAAPAAGPSTVVNVDNTAPTIAIGAPAPTATRTGPVSFTVTYGGADGVSLAAGHVHVTAGGSAAYTNVAVSGTGNASRTVTLSGLSGNGTLGISIDAGTASDAAGNTAPAAGLGTTVEVDNVAPTVAIGAPSATLTGTGPVMYTVSYTGASAIGLAPANITLHNTGTAAGQVAVSGSGTDQRTVTVQNITGDGTLGISIAAGTASDAAGNTAPAAGPATSFRVSNGELSASIGAPSVANTRSGPVQFLVTYANAESISLNEGYISLNRGGTADAATVTVANTGSTTRTVTLSGLTGNGALGISIAADSARDAFDNPAPAAGPSSTVNVDNTPPTVTVGAPSVSATRTGPVDFLVTYGGADSISLASGHITLNTTGGASASTVTVLNTSSTTRTVRVSNIAGNGTIGITVAAGTASDLAGNAAPQAAGAAFAVDNVAPTVSIGAPSLGATNSGPVSFTVTYGGADAVSLSAAHISLIKTGTANASSVTVSGTGNATRTVTLSGISGDGTLAIAIAAGTAADAAGNSAPAPAASATVDVDNVGVTLAVGGPSLALTNTGPVTYELAYSGANSIALAPAHVTLIKTGTADGTVQISGNGNSRRIVSIANITGDGTLAIAVAAGTASDHAGNQAPAAGPAVAFTVDNSPPTMEVTGPSPEVSCGGNITYRVKYTDAQPLYLNAGHVVLHTTGTAAADVEVNAISDDNHVIQLKQVRGMGTVTISITEGSAVDGAGNPTPAWGPAPGIAHIDMIAPTLTIGPPSTTLTRNGPVTYTVTYTDAEEIHLGPERITLNTTGTANGIVSVSGEGNTTRTVTVSNVTGDGTLGISIAGDTASDDTCNVSLPSSGNSQTFTVDNTPPSVSIGAPSAPITNNADVTFTVAYDGAGAISLQPADVSLVSSGTATGQVSVSGSGTALRTVRVSNITGDGTLAIALAGGTAVDAAGNAALAAGPSQPFTVDNTPPTLTIGPPSLAKTNTGPVAFTVTYAGADTILLTPDLVQLNSDGTATGTVSVLGSDPASRTVQISNISGDGALGISIGAGSAADAAGNEAAAAGPSITFAVDNTPPTIAIGQPSASVTRHGPVTFAIAYSGAQAVDLGVDDIALAATGSANATVSVQGSGNTARTVVLDDISGDGTLGIAIAAGTAVDDVGNVSLASGPSATFTVDNTPPEVLIGAPSAWVTRGGPVTVTVTFAGESSLALPAGRVTLNTSGTATGEVAVSDSGAHTRLVTISDITGDGALGISIAAGAATDAAGNVSVATGPSETFTVDNTPPTVAIGAPSATVTAFGPVTFPVTYNGASEVSLALADIQLHRTGNADGMVSVSGSGATQRVVSITNISGNGTLSISVAAGTARDAAGNLAPAPAPGAAFQVSNAELSVSIGAPSAALTRGGPVEFEVAYNNAAAVSLSPANITTVSTGTAAGTVSVLGSGTAGRVVRISDITGDGSLAVAIAANSAQDEYGRPAPAAGPSAAFAVDNTPPTAVIGPPSVTATGTGPVTFAVQYTGADSVDLDENDIGVLKTGTAAGVASVAQAGPSTWLVTLSDVTGKGTLAILVAEGTAEDAAGNVAAAAGPSATVAVDDGRPVVTIGPPSASITRHGPVSFVVGYTNAAVVNLTPGDVALNTAGSVTGSVSVSGTGSTQRLVTVSNLQGDGSFNIAIGANTAVNGVGNKALGAGPSASVVVDNTPPVIALRGETPVVMEFSVPYADSGVEALDNVDGDITPRVFANNFVNPWMEGTYTVTYAVTDTAGNPAVPVTRTVTVVRRPENETVVEFLGGTICRPGICVTLRPNTLFTPAGAIKLLIDRPAPGILPADIFTALVPGTWFDVRPNEYYARNLGIVKLYYPDLDQDGVVDGTHFNEADLFVYFVDMSNGAISMIKGAVNGLENTVSVNTDRFGVFAVGCLTRDDPDAGDDELDSDGDGLSDAAEMGIGTNPENPDTDGDGVSDGREVTFGGDPLDPENTPELSTASRGGLLVLVSALIAAGGLAALRLRRSGRAASSHAQATQQQERNTDAK